MTKSWFVMIKMLVIWLVYYWKLQALAVRYDICPIKKTLDSEISKPST